MNQIVTIKSTIGAQIYVSIPHINLRRSWPQKGAIVRIPMNIMEEAVYDLGFETMLRSGDLYIEDMEQKIHLGLEEPEAVVPTQVIVLTEKEQAELLEKSNKEFAEAFEKLSRQQQSELADFAVSSKASINRIKNDLFKKTLGVDVIEIVNLHEEEEASN